MNKIDFKKVLYEKEILGKKYETWKLILTEERNTFLIWLEVINKEEIPPSGFDWDFKYTIIKNYFDKNTAIEEAVNLSNDISKCKLLIENNI